MRDFFRPARLGGGGSGIKLSLLAQSGPKRGVSGVLGEFCTGWARRGCEPGEFCTVTGPACGTKFSLLGLLVGVSAKKFALRVQNSPKSAVCGVLGEFFRGNAGGGGVPGELFRENTVVGAALGELFRG